MPEMAGTELAVEIARLRPGLQVILMTGHPEMAEMAGATLPLLPKPLDRNVMESMIGTAFADESVGQPHPAH